MDVFISHSHHDSETATRLATRLRAAGHKVYLDEAIPPGESLTTSIAAAMKASDVYLILVSEPFLRSEWSTIEIAGALAQSEESAKRVIPVRVESGVELPPLLRDRRAIDLTGSGAGERDLIELERLLAAPAPRAAAPDFRESEDEVRLLEAARRYVTIQSAEYLAEREKRELRLRLWFAYLVVVAVTLLVGALAVFVVRGESIAAGSLGLAAGILVGATGALSAVAVGRLGSPDRTPPEWADRKGRDDDRI